jgi:RNA polymerase sigma factor (TIGR02999 family)
MAREPAGLTLQPTDLVHEAYLRLVGEDDPGWSGRAHFYGAAAEAMRRILIERARRVARVKHGGHLRRTSATDIGSGSIPLTEDLLVVDEVLGRLEKQDGGMATVVKLRYFAGLTVEETARCLELSPRTVDRRWEAARAWMHREMGQVQA